MLEGPPQPDVVMYLWRWLREIRGGLGEGLSGPAPLTWDALKAWSEMTQRTLTPREVDMLFVLDVIVRHPDVTLI